MVHILHMNGFYVNVISPVSQLVGLYCRECACAVCDDCICGDHEGHSTAPIRQALELQRTTLQDTLESAKAR